MRVITLEDAALRLGLSPRSLADKRFQIRIGLPGIKLGRRLGFDEGISSGLLLMAERRCP